MSTKEAAHSDPEKLYGKRASLYHVGLVMLTGYGRGLRAFLAKADYLRAGYRVLDAGCGSGILTRHLSDFSVKKKLPGVKFHAFDLTQAMLDIFQGWLAKQGRKNLNVRKGDVLRPESLPKDWTRYDLIVTASMLEHLPRDQMVPAMGNLARLLKDDGKMVVFITRRNLFMRFFIQMAWGANLYTRAEVEQALREAGFQTVAFKHFPFPHNLLGLWGMIFEATDRKPA